MFDRSNHIYIKEFSCEIAEKRYKYYRFFYFIYLIIFV